VTRYRSYGQKDDQAVLEGDLQLSGVDERRSPESLPAGLVARAINKDFRQGVAETRRGLTTVRWAGEPAVDFPIDFLQDHEFLALFSSDPACYADLNFRVYGGTTLQLRSAAPSGWHAIAVDTNAGVVSLWLDTNPMSDANWSYAAYNQANANFRLLDDTTLQLRNLTTGLWHSIYVIDVAGVGVLAVDQAGMTDNQAHAAALYPSFMVRNDETLQLRNVSTNNWHTIFVEYVGGIPLVAIDTYGMEAEGFDFDKVTGFGKVYGTCEFSDPYGQEGILIAVETGVVRIMPNTEPTYIRLPNDEPIEEDVCMIQCFDRVLMFRGPDKSVLVWNPANEMSAITQDFEELVQTAAPNTTDPAHTSAIYADGTQDIPQASEATFLNNRVYVISGRDEIVVSDILDYTRYGVATGQFKINEGSDDELVRLFPSNRSTLIAFKTQSIHALTNLTGNLAEVTNEVLTMSFGCIARNSIVTDGKDIFFFSEGGIRAIGQILDNQLQLKTEPLSGPIQPIIDRINWSQAGLIAGGYIDNKLYWAIPIDGAQYNNAMIVFDGINGTWSGYWTNESMMDVHTFVRTNSAGRRRLFAVNRDNLADRKANGAVYIVGRGFTDYLYDEEFQIEDEVITRGYATQTIDRKRSMHLYVHQATWDPTFSIDAILDGVGETKNLADEETRSRTRYYVHGRADYDEENPNDDHALPYREDYSVHLDQYEEIDLGDNGVNPQLMQRRMEPYRIDRRGTYCQLRIRNTQGRYNLHGIAIESSAGDRAPRAGA